MLGSIFTATRTLTVSDLFRQHGKLLTSAVEINRLADVYSEGNGDVKPSVPLMYNRGPVWSGETIDLTGDSEDEEQ